MRRTLKHFRSKALARPEVKLEYERLGEEFEFLDEILKACAAAGLTQADVAARIGTTQSAVARLESADAKHSPDGCDLAALCIGVGLQAPAQAH